MKNKPAKALLPGSKRVENGPENYPKIGQMIFMLLNCHPRVASVSQLVEEHSRGTRESVGDHAEPFHLQAPIILLAVSLVREESFGPAFGLNPENCGKWYGSLAIYISLFYSRYIFYHLKLYVLFKDIYSTVDIGNCDYLGTWAK